GMVLLQSLIILGLSYLAGARFAGDGASIAILLAGTVLLGTAFAAFSNALALLLRKQESLIALNVTLVLPLTFLSSTFLPAKLMPRWMQEFAKFNPVNWAWGGGPRAAPERLRLSVGGRPPARAAGAGARLRLALHARLPRLSALRLAPDTPLGLPPSGCSVQRHRQPRDSPQALATPD